MKKYLTLFLVAVTSVFPGNPVFARQKTDSTKYPLILKFYSIGSGVPGSQPLKDFINTYQNKNKLPELKATMVGGLGREGEYAILFPLKELNSTQRKKFIDTLSKVLPTLKDKSEAGGINMAQNETFDASRGRMQPEAVTF